MTDIATVPTEKLRSWLITGGDLAEGRHQRAAAELLDAAGLLDRREVRATSTPAWSPDTDDRPHLIARVDWRALAAGDRGPLGGAQRRLLDLAVSLGGGVPVDLRSVSAAANSATACQADAVVDIVLDGSAVLAVDDHRRPPRGSPTTGSGPQSLPGCASTRLR